MKLRSRAKYIFVLPGIIWVLCFTMFPLLYSLRLSFMQAKMGTPEHFIGFKTISVPSATTVSGTPPSSRFFLSYAALS